MSRSSVAVVTGASEGIGRGIAIKLGKEGYLTVLSSRNEKLLQATADKISEAGGSYYTVPADISESADVQRLFRVAGKLGRLRVLVNNAGVGVFAAVEDLPLEDWQRMLDVNLTGAFLCTQYAVRMMKKEQGGHIVFINSLSGKRPLPYGAGYSASKYGLKGLADTARLELRKFNIKITSIFPGAVDSSWWDKLDYDFPRDRMVTVGNVVDVVWAAICQQGRSVIEEIDVRQVGGDF